MTGTSKLHSTLERIERAIAKLPSNEALNLIDIEIADPRNADYRPHIEVRKGGILWYAGQTQEAAELLERCAIEYDNVDSVHYFSGEYLLQLGQYARAIPYFGRCVEIAESTDNRWYQDAAYLLRAYCAAKIGNFDLARQDLFRLDDEESMSWLTADPIVSKTSIMLMMNEEL
jgi:tetratricopeptide (TPR) repeat protein